MHAAYSVTIGLQQTTYTVSEVDQHQLVCLEVLSGDVDGREFVINYATSSGTAGKLSYCEHFSGVLYVTIYNKYTLILL